MNNFLKKIFIIIQARMTSSRLPGKVMLPVGPKPALQFVVERLAPLSSIARVIIATTDDGSEAPITALCEKLGVGYFRGDTEDVLGRYYGAATDAGAKRGDVIVRLTSDCPLIDPDILKKTVDRFVSGGFDYVSNVEKRTYPRGLDVEVFSFESLELANSKAAEKFEREHVTAYIESTHRSEFRLGSVEDAEDNSKFRITLDEPDDYSAICEIYKLLGYRTDFSYGELIRLLKANPYIFEMNHHVEQKKV